MLSALLVAELLLAAPPAAEARETRPREPLQWEVPGQVSVVEVPAEMDVGGIPVRLRVVNSREKVDGLLKFFMKAFDEAGFYIPPEQRSPVAQPRLTALDTRALTSYTVVLTPQPGGTTEVVIGQARMKERRQAAAPTLPVFPGGKDVLQSDFEGAQTLGYQVEAKEAEVKAWYREQLERAGYREEEPLLFRRKEQELRLDVTPKGKGLHVFLFLRTSGEPPPMPQ